MKKLNILTPIVTIGSLGAIVTPMTILTSCGGGSSGKDADLIKGYTPTIKPAAAKTYKGSTGEAEALKDYFNEIGINSNRDYEPLKEDVWFSYSEAFKTTTFKSMGFVFDSYKLDFADIEGTANPYTLNCKFIADATGSYKNETYGINVTEGKFHAEYKFQKPFDIEFKKADDTTWKKMNYLKFILGGKGTGYKVDYKLTGSFKYNGQQMECPGVQVTDHYFLDYTDAFGIVTDLLVAEGLTCNLKTWDEYGVVYAYHFKDATFTD